MRAQAMSWAPMRRLLPRWVLLSSIARRRWAMRAGMGTGICAVVSLAFSAVSFGSTGRGTRAVARDLASAI